MGAPFYFMYRQGGMNPPWLRRISGGSLRSHGRCGRAFYRLKPAINCLAVRGVRPGWCIRPKESADSLGAPFYFMYRQGGMNPPWLRRISGGSLRSRGRCGRAFYSLKPAINCLAVRGVRPG
ncbi:hypothetical protein CE91St41_13770 [Oscillospiraceae bacterium]|nr:hypothetical protein CE91St40_23770 [Oscillospiraceae bacterium]BDF74488.1 hypothetical protein CE91St41_13770 [Oscillospiraceae bacterium]